MWKHSGANQSQGRTILIVINDAWEMQQDFGRLGQLGKEQSQKEKGLLDLTCQWKHHIQPGSYRNLKAKAGNLTGCLSTSSPSGLQGNLCVYQLTPSMTQIRSISEDILLEYPHRTHFCRVVDKQLF